MSKPKKTKVFKISPLQRFKMWLFSHVTAFKQSFKQIWAAPITSLTTLGVFAIVLCLPVALFWVSDNLQTLTQRWEQSGEITVFLKDDVTTTQAEALRKAWYQYAAVEKITYVSPEDALAEFSRLSNMTDVASALDKNPLPGVLIVTPSTHDLTALKQLRDELLAKPEVAVAQLDMEWVIRLQAILFILKQSVLTLGVLLGVGLLLVMANTIRSNLAEREAEIHLAKLVGATDRYVRRPFLYTGLWFGFLGSVLGLAVLWMAGMAMKAPMQHLLSAYASEWQPQALSPNILMAIIGLAMLLGMLGAWFSVSRYLRSLRPR